MKTNTFKFLVLSAAIAALSFGCTTAQNNSVARDTAGKCDAEGFVARIRAKGCYLSNNDERRIKQNAEYCKQLANRFQIVSMERSGDVVVLDTQRCDRAKYEVDASGINELRIIQDYAYLTSNDGQLYAFSSHTQNFYELRSNSGQSYSRRNGSHVTDIKGGQGGTVVYTTHGNGTTQEWDGSKLNSMGSQRLRKLNFWTYGSAGSVYND